MSAFVVNRANIDAIVSWINCNIDIDEFNNGDITITDIFENTAQGNPDVDEDIVEEAASVWVNRQGA